MRKLMTWAFFANLLLLAVAARIQSDIVAVHFTSNGAPDVWASKNVSILVLLAVEVTLFVLLRAVGRLSTRAQGPGNAASQACQRSARLAVLMPQFGFALFVFLFFVGSLTFAANLREAVRLDHTLLLAGTGCYLLYLAFWVVTLARGLKKSR
jgi:hypothetical protein